jgi:chitin synthase
MWAVYNEDIFDLTDYFGTLAQFQNAAQYAFLDPDVTDVFKDQLGQDVTKALDAVYAGKNPDTVRATKACLSNVFYAGQRDFRKTPRCLVADYFMLAASVVLMASMAVKCECSA